MRGGFVDSALMFGTGSCAPAAIAEPLALYRAVTKYPRVRAPARIKTDGKSASILGGEGGIRTLAGACAPLTI
jgi:hypothetical protein